MKDSMTSATIALVSNSNITSPSHELSNGPSIKLVSFMSIDLSTSEDYFFRVVK